MYINRVFKTDEQLSLVNLLGTDVKELRQKSKVYLKAPLSAEYF